MKKMIERWIIRIWTFVMLISVQKTQAQETDVLIHEWLLVGPFTVEKPLFYERLSNQKAFSDRQLLEISWIDMEKLQPAEGQPLNLMQKDRIWKTVLLDSTGHLIHPPAQGYARYLLATYIEVKEWMQVKLVFSGRHLFQVFLNNQIITSKTVAEDSIKKETGKAEAEVKLEKGKHLLIVHMLQSPAGGETRSLHGVIRVPKEKAKQLCITTSPFRTVELRHILDVPRITGVQLSPDGEWALISMAQAQGDQTETWHEIRTTKERALIHTTRGSGAMIQPQWLPHGKTLSYLTQNNKEFSFWLRDFSDGVLKTVLRNIKNVTRYFWSPLGDALYYEVSEKSEPVKTGLKKLEGLRDRQPGMNNRTVIYRYRILEGINEQLTVGLPSLNLYNISPDGKKVLFIRQRENLQRRPYVETTFFLYNFLTFSLDSLWTIGWFGDVVWSPDGSQLLITGGPSLFGSVGIRLPDKKMIPNDYDYQAYLVDLRSKKPRCISLDFNPSIDDVSWNRYDGKIYMVTTDRSYRTVYRFDPATNRYEKLETGEDAVSEFYPALNAPIAIYYGSGAGSPQKAYWMDLRSKQYQLFLYPGEEDFRQVRIGKIKPWTFRNKQRIEIDGYVHYPPDFDSTQKYPCIVYYYGGTTPVTRDFGGRYAKEWYAANGYIVYTLQPSGAKGYGQAFSALHVNNWGITVADEIIDGVNQFLNAHPYVDKKRVGCIGASYGGFMTMLLTTKTTMFATAISHAGISSISSYWGEGYWGYAYSAMATANSFPWNRKDIYVNQSPLFFADKIKTPLLLLHGTADNNVPVGESIQLYTALKLLNRPVELVQVEDQDHLILHYSKRKHWTKTIMAWFDRWLKDQPDWWNDLYKSNQ